VRRVVAGAVELNRTGRSGTRYGSGRRKTEFTTLNSATLAPIPRPRPRIATTVPRRRPTCCRTHGKWRFLIPWSAKASGERSVARLKPSRYVDIGNVMPNRDLRCELLPIR